MKRASRSSAARRPSCRGSIGRASSTSPRLYLGPALALRGRAKAFAHITGGGIAGNLARVLPAERSAELDWDSWQRPPVFGWLARHVGEDELRRVFNLGIGFCAVVTDTAAGETVIGRIA